MLKNQTIKIKSKGCRKIPLFISLGYDVSQDYIEIHIKDLNIGSREIVDAYCDFCNKEVSVSYREYCRNISIGGRYACSKYCGSIKARETNINKYGKIHPMCLIENQEKQKKTNLEKYGVEYLQQSSDIRLKSKETLLYRYNVDHISKTNHFKSKSKRTNLERRGVEYPTQSKEVKDKCKETSLKNYGVDNPSKSKKVKDLIIVNNIQKYGVCHVFQHNEFKDKIKISNLEKYGVDNIMKNEEFRKEKFNVCKDKDYLYHLSHSHSIYNCSLGHTFSINSDNYLKRRDSNLPLCTVCYPIDNHVSIKQRQIFDFISSIYNDEIVENYRIDFEIDIYLPNLKIGFEFNGLYWHSEKYKDKNYHLDKTNYFKERGIRIIHIWEDDWDFKQDIVKSQISNWLRRTNRKIYARKCDVREILDNKLLRIFLDENHIQGYVQSKIKIGLFYDEELVSLMIFDKSEGRKRIEDSGWNLSRFCNKINTNVIGSASKLLSYFIRKYQPSKIISYADMSWSEGGLYHKLGFFGVQNSNPDYKYIINGIRKHKQNYKKSNLNISEGETENEYMRSMGYLRIWDCGKSKFEIIINNSN